MTCRRRDCWVPGPHTHRPPNKAEVAEARYPLVIEHPAHCSWRKDVYDGCDCGVTGAVTAIEDLMRPRSQEGA